MDVICHHCSTQYDFDDARIPETGLDVRCSHCGNVFHVRPGADEGPDTVDHEPKVVVDASLAARAHEDHPWFIRKLNGEELEFRSFSTLQRWIIERRVGREDRLSRGKEQWKALGEIVELSSFFLAVEGIGGARPPAPSTPPRVSPPPPSGPTMSPPPLTPPPMTPSPMASGPESLGTAPTPIPEPPPEVGNVRVMEQRPTLDLRTPAGAAAASELPPPREAQDPPTIRRMPAATPPPTVNMIPPGVTPPPLGRQGPDPMMTPAPPFVGPADPGWGEDIPLRNPESLDMQMEEEPLAPAPQRPSAFWPFVAGIAVCAAAMVIVYFTVLRDDKTKPATAATVAGESPKLKTNPTKPRAEAKAPEPAGMAIGEREEPARPDPVARAKALDEARAALTAGNTARARNQQAKLIEAEGHYGRALALSVEGPEADQIRVAAHEGLAWIAIVRGDYQRILEGRAATEHVAAAERAIAEAKKIAPESPRLSILDAELQRVQGEREAAKARLEHARAQLGETPRFRLAEGAIGQLSEDGAEMLKAMQGVPGEAEALPRGRTFKAIALHKAGQTTEALALLDALLVDNPEHPAAAPLKERFTAEAEKARAAAAKAAAQESPVEMSFDKLMSKGDRLLEQGRTHKASKLFKEAVNKNPRSPEPRSALGWCYLDQGNFSMAIRQFSEALSRSGRYADAMYGIAVARERARQNDKARQAYQAYLDTHPGGRHARMARRKLELLQ